MTIKVKHIKFTLLIICVVFLTGFNYFSFVKADDSAATPTTLDSDNDGLSDAEENLYGTDPKNPDTDGDGYSDGVEIESGYDPLKPAPDDKIATTNPDQATIERVATTTTSLTDTLTQDLQEFVASKGENSVTNEELQSFTADAFANIAGDQITFDTLPAFDSSQVKVLDQTYASLTSDEKKKQITKDAKIYFSRGAYIMISNSPKTLVTQEDFTSVLNDFETNLSSLTTSAPNYTYFEDLGERLNFILEQSTDIEVPQTFLELHVKIIRLAMGYSELQKLAVSENDPLAKIVLMTKMKNLIALSQEFIEGDFTEYCNQFTE